jgi:hypothetical protein
MGDADVEAAGKVPAEPFLLEQKIAVPSRSIANH